MTRCLRALLALALVVLGAQAFAQQPWRVYPPVPTAGEPFVIQYEAATGQGPDFVRRASVTQQGATLVYDIDVETAGFSAGGAYRASTVVPGLTAGQYQVVVQSRVDSASGPAVPLGTISIAPAQGPAAAAYAGLSGNWFDPNESGWGMNIVQGDSGALFAVWLTYLPIFEGDAGGRKDGMWLVMPAGRWISPTQFRGLLYATSGTAASRPFKPGDLAVTPAGYVSLELSSATQATMKAGAAVGLFAPFAKEAAIRRFQF